MNVTINVVEVLSVIAFFGLFFFAISYMGLKDQVRSLENRVSDLEHGRVDSGQTDY